MLHILGQEQLAICLGSSREDYRIPDAKLLYGKVNGGQEDRGRGLNQTKGIAPAEDGRAGVGGRTAGLPHQNLKEFAQDLNGKDDGTLRQALYQLQGGFFHGCAVNALGVRQDIGIEGNPHCASS
jgi:hypothetical protein